MTIISTITGLIIAALLSVPGTTQQEAPQAGEEIVVGEVKKIKDFDDEVWYIYTGVRKEVDATAYQSQILNPTNYMNTSSPTYTGCLGDDQICAIRLPDSTLPHPDPGAFSQISQDIANESDASGAIQLEL